MMTYRCPVALTNKAKDKLQELGLNERSLFSAKPFRVYIEKYVQTADRGLSAALFFDNELRLILHGAVEKDRFVVINVTKRAAHAPAKTNWRRLVSLTFELSGQRGGVVPLALLQLIHEMPAAQEKSLYVKKRIASWEGYLNIQERAADIPDMLASYAGLTFNGDFSRVTIMGCKLGEKEWGLLKDLSVRLKGMDQDIGKVLKANRSARTVEVELSAEMAKRARQQRLRAQSKEVIFSNFAALSQVKRLRQGFRSLENGLAANPELERLLFEDKPPVQKPKSQVKPRFYNELNSFQQEAVIGAMAAKDLYVIQGPPGTGKTTVISEICLQNAKAGLRTLVASQSNLAVDNALGRLLANQDIRILRVGRTESIEEEGKRFIEENVGQYWKDQTLREVSAQFQARERRKGEIEIEWAANEQREAQLQPVLARVEAELEAKQQAKQRADGLQARIEQQKKHVHTADEEHRMLQRRVQELKRSLELLQASLEKDEAFLRREDRGVLQAEIAANEHILQQLRHSISCQELAERMAEKKQNLGRIAAEGEAYLAAVKQLEAAMAKVTAVKKLDELQFVMREQGVHQSFGVRQLIWELERTREQMEQLEKLEAYKDKLNRAILYVEQHYRVRTDEPNGQFAYTAADIDDFLDGLRDELRGRTTSERLAMYLKKLYDMRHFVHDREDHLQRLNLTSKAKESFRQLRQTVLEEIRDMRDEHHTSHQQLLYKLEEYKKNLQALQTKHQQMTASTAQIPHARERLTKEEAKALALEQRKVQHEQAQQRLAANVARKEQTATVLQQEEKKLAQLEGSLTQLRQTLQQHEEERASLEAVLSTTPEQEHEQVLKQLASVSFTRGSLQQEKQKLPLLQSIQDKWISLLEEATDHDLDEIRKLYVKHANVIGTTCVASARKDFMESYPVFDVVIIDEVSKATPPELLLPMLKGKKIILVGDHHQLPPLLGNDTLEEALQEMADDSEAFAGKAELEKLLKESLFERLFRQLPSTHKTMLAIQYRMHEDIMATIAPFYEQKNGRLQCGLTESDAARDHLLESARIRRDNHLIWLDMPNEPAYFEERMKDGKSLYNPAELQQMGALLKELDEATAEAKRAGRLGTDDKKSVGVISFYGEQVKRIDRLLQQELRLQHVTIRTGTVDRFQGMEMDVIVLSMVRNHKHKHDDIGFANDYRRLNVALSRARELLVLIGSTAMFTERAKRTDTKRMYTHVLETVKQQRGLRLLEEVK